MPSYQAPRGMRDLLPEEAAAFDALQAVIEARALRYGYPRIVTPIVEGLHKLIASFDPEFQTRLKNRVLLAGGGSQIKGLDLAIETEMRKRLGAGRVVRIEEPVYGGANGALKIAHDMPAEYWEKLK